MTVVTREFTRRVGARLVGLLVFAPAAAFAQAPADGPSPSPAPATALAQSDTDASNEPVGAPTPASAASAAEVDASVESDADSPADPSVLDNLDVNVFADSYYLVDWARPQAPTAPTDVSHRAFDSANGFGLAFAGVDMAYEEDGFGARIDLRFGEGAERLIGNDRPGFSILKQAYATWKPIDRLTLDLGYFDTIYGAEVADSWRNLNYTRGALYYLMQPFYHEGLRASVQAAEPLTVTAIVVNGTNNPVDNNSSPHVGLQTRYTPVEALSFAVGYYTGAGSSGFGDMTQPTTDDDFEHFFDAVASAQAGRWTVILNGDAYLGRDEMHRRVSFWGASGAVGFRLIDELGLAYRSELLGDPDRYIGDGWQRLTTQTLTLDYQPTRHLILRLDGRYERADSQIFTTSDGPMGSRNWFATTIGLVLTAS